MGINKWDAIRKDNKTYDTFVRLIRETDALFGSCSHY